MTDAPPHRPGFARFQPAQAHPRIERISWCGHWLDRDRLAEGCDTPAAAIPDGYCAKTVVEVSIVYASARAEVEPGAIDRRFSDRVQPLVNVDARVGRDAQHELAGGHVTDLEVRVGAEGDRSIRRTDVSPNMSDLEPVSGESIRHLRVEEKPITGLRKDGRAQRDRIVGPGSFAIGRETEKSVNGILPGRLGEGELLFGSVVRLNPVTNAVGPRHEHDAGSHRRCRLGRIRLDEVNAVYGI